MNRKTIIVSECKCTNKLLCVFVWEKVEATLSRDGDVYTVSAEVTDHNSLKQLYTGQVAVVEEPLKTISQYQPDKIFQEFEPGNVRAFTCSDENIQVQIRFDYIDYTLSAVLKAPTNEDTQIVELKSKIIELEKRLNELEHPRVTRETSYLTVPVEDLYRYSQEYNNVDYKKHAEVLRDLDYKDEEVVIYYLKMIIYAFDEQFHYLQLFLNYKANVEGKLVCAARMHQTQCRIVCDWIEYKPVENKGERYAVRMSFDPLPGGFKCERANTSGEELVYNCSRIRMLYIEACPV